MVSDQLVSVVLKELEANTLQEAKQISECAFGITRYPSAVVVGNLFRVELTVSGGIPVCSLRPSCHLLRDIFTDFGRSDGLLRCGPSSYFKVAAVFDHCRQRQNDGVGFGAEALDCGLYALADEEMVPNPRVESVLAVDAWCARRIAVPDESHAVVVVNPAKDDIQFSLLHPIRQITGLLRCVTLRSFLLTHLLVSEKRVQF